MTMTNTTLTVDQVVAAGLVAVAAGTLTAARWPHLPQWIAREWHYRRQWRQLDKENR